MADGTTVVNLAWNGAVHPAADIFPMIDGLGLEQLADNIRERGLVEPGWLMPDGTLLDGRNRRLACERAGVQMQWRVYRDSDPVGFIIALNIYRRHLTTGQLAMIATQIEPMYAEMALARKVTARENSHHVARQDEADRPHLDAQRGGSSLVPSLCAPTPFRRTSARSVWRSSPVGRWSSGDDKC